MVRQFSARHYRPLLPSSILIANLIQSLSSPANADPLFTAAVFALYVAAVWIIPRLTPIPALLSIFASLWLSASLLWIVSGHEQGSALFLMAFLTVYVSSKLPGRLSAIFVAFLVISNSLLVFSVYHSGLGVLIDNAAVITGLYILFTSFRIRKEARQETERNHAKLAHMHKELEKAHAELQQAHLELKEASVLSLRYAVLKERTRIARDIHDSIGHELTSVIVQLQSLPYVLKGSAENPEKVIQNVLTVARGCLGEVRSVVHQMGKCEAMVGLAAIRGLIHQTGERSDLAISLDTYGLQEESWPQNVSETVYRVLQEPLTNILRHAGASRADIVLSNDECRLNMTVSDDGEFSGDLTFGFGLTGMKERAEQAGGSFFIKALQPSGMQVELQLPLTQQINKEEAV
ncbi:sensor histidine kinase [Bacillus glycinifermentans]|uniref:sensor histidine kinase n=1 Tax=Bacillus glycinifermentans TaxID=1664069 RepID=UPI002DB5EBC1|nr:sensor histidine kinase [Bacillus glycinifermentans]MEC3607684.1 sensor histidine kinase [Bacillus glycinifermentans]